MNYKLIPNIIIISIGLFIYTYQLYYLQDNTLFIEIQRNILNSKPDLIHQIQSYFIFILSFNIVFLILSVEACHIFANKFYQKIIKIDYLFSIFLFLVVFPFLFLPTFMHVTGVQGIFTNHSIIANMNSKATIYVYKKDKFSCYEKQAVKCLQYKNLKDCLISNGYGNFIPN